MKTIVTSFIPGLIHQRCETLTFSATFIHKQPAKIYYFLYIFVNKHMLDNHNGSRWQAGSTEIPDVILAILGFALVYTWLAVLDISLVLAKNAQG